MPRLPRRVQRRNQIAHVREGVIKTDPSGFPDSIPLDELIDTVGGGNVHGPGASTDTGIPRWVGTDGEHLGDTTGPTMPNDGRIATTTDPIDDQDVATKHWVLQIVTPPANTSFLVSGGQVIWQSGFTFLVSAAVYYIQGVLYSSPQETVVLDAADGTFDRIDVIVVNTSGHADKVTGTPSSTPSEPDIDPTTQLQLAIVLVPTGATQPVIDTRLLYAENVGSPTEFDWTSSSGTIVLNSTSNPRNGTKDIEGTAVVQNAFIQGTIGSGNIDPTDFDHLVFYVRSKAAWPNTRQFSCRFYTGTVAVGAAVNVSNGQFGFDSAITGSYQQIAIPLSLFALPGGTLITRLRITRTGSGTNGWYMDDISLVLMDTPTGDFLTQAQADARYAPLVHHTRHEPDGADALGERTTVRLATTGNITIATALNAGDTLDGKTIADGDLILVKDQSTASQNGFYIGGATPVRAPQFNSYNEHPGVLVTVQEGTTNADTKWICTSDKGGTLDTTAIVFAADTGGGGSSLPVVDTTAIVKGSGDATKLVRIEADTNVPTATTIVITAPSADASLEPNVTYAAALHHTRHEAGGADKIKIDDLEPGDDNTDLNASTTKHGLMPKGDGNTAHFYRSDMSQAAPVTFTKGGFGATFDGRSAVVAVGKKVYWRAPAGCNGTITKVTMVADQSGSCTMTIKKSTFSGFPGSLTSIVASAKPTLSSQQKSEDSTLSGWTTGVTEGDMFEWTIDTATTVQWVGCFLDITLS